ncbi:(-)-beta-pinene synthase, chloroplastic [Artemisia annua]|uniref:(-)-beta-pinene synthase, chloroplastic n=1 Tax=Artemisia annua TaxID=35608 RepID=A0A2U1KF54_ARTAN|nr:(-)-beta-pinene synthase, chloroplastic [Artemisia annua]
MASMCTLSSPFLLCNSSISRTNIVACNKQTSTLQPQLKNVATIETTNRRSANYAPSLWSYDFVQSLSSKYKGDNYMARSRALKGVVRTMISEANGIENPLSLLNLVDDLQRLGISYHFLDEISNVLEKIYLNFYQSHEKWTLILLSCRMLDHRYYNPLYGIFSTCLGRDDSKAIYRTFGMEIFKGRKSSSGTAKFV